MKLRTVLLLSGLAGFLALTQEMVWFRIAGIGFRDEPTVFGYVLGWMLVGLAAGAWLGPRLMDRTAWSAPRLVALSFSLSALVGFFTITLVSRVFVLGLEWGQTAIHVSIAVVALANGIAFPLLCHAGTEGSTESGRVVGWIYFANILGSTLAPLVTGFVLFEVLGTERLLLALPLGFLAAAGLALLLDHGPRARPFAGLFGLAACLVLVHPWAHGRTVERLEHGPEFDQPGKRYRRLIETHSGLITITASTPTDIIAGGGVYDGRFNTDLAQDDNAVFRAYAATALVENPQDVLVIGLSSGSWAKVVANHRAVKSMVAVEINPGYLEAIEGYPTASLLTDPRVKIVIDDGRRWLVRNPEAKFDLIVMNTTVHWRANSTNLLSVEFMRLAKAHLKPGGALFYNTTMSADAIHTGASLFGDRTLVYNSLGVSDGDLHPPREVRRARLMGLEDDGQPYFEVPGNAPYLEPLLDRFDRRHRFDKGRVVTDDNMLTEFGDKRLPGNWLSLAHALHLSLTGGERPAATPQPAARD